MATIMNEMPIGAGAIVDAETYEPVTSATKVVSLSQPASPAAEQYRVLRYRLECLARDGFKALADDYGAQLRVTRLRPSGRGADTWHELHPTAEQQRQIYRWLLAHGDQVLTGDSFFHLNALGEPLHRLEVVQR